MKWFIWKLMMHIRRFAWTFIVAYMLGLHNFYNGDNKLPNSIVIRIEQKQKQEDGEKKSDT